MEWKYRAIQYPVLLTSLLLTSQKVWQTACNFKYFTHLASDIHKEAAWNVLKSGWHGYPGGKFELWHRLWKLAMWFTDELLTFFDRHDVATYTIVDMSFLMQNTSMTSRWKENKVIFFLKRGHHVYFCMLTYINLTKKDVANISVFLTDTFAK